MLELCFVNNVPNFEIWRITDQQKRFTNLRAASGMGVKLVLKTTVTTDQRVDL